jgi:glycosyltransferase involved in cell wall biosynthesis
MRHLHFTQSLEPLQGGGLGQAALDLHLQLLRDGSLSRLVATRSTSFDRVWPETLQYARSGPEKAYFARKLGREVESLLAQVDVVHGHGFYVYPNWAVGGLAVAKHKSLVYHPHGMFEPWILNRSRLKKKVVSILFEDRNMGQCQLWRALTAREADQIRQRGFSAPIVVAPNGVRLEDYDGALPNGNGHALALPERAAQKKRLVFMARLHPKKGLDLLVPAWAQLKQYHPHWELLIAGPDENGYRAAVETMIRELDVASATTLVGPVTGAAKRELLKGAALFVLPSYSEGFPVSVLEAMACGVPVIGTDGCNFPELETEGGGWICQAQADSVFKALEAALQGTDTERKERGRAARKLVERRYTWPAIAAAIRDACESYCA